MSSPQGAAGSRHGPAGEIAEILISVVSGAKTSWQKDTGVAESTILARSAVRPRVDTIVSTFRVCRDGPRLR